MQVFHRGECAFVTTIDTGYVIVRTPQQIRPRRPASTTSWLGSLRLNHIQMGELVFGRIQTRFGFTAHSIGIRWRPLSPRSNRTRCVTRH